MTIEIPNKITPRIPPYQAKAFCDRPIIKEILSTVERIGSGVIQPPIIIQAERGSGKTWLSLHLHRVILKLESHTKSLLLCLSEPLDLEPEENEWFLSQEQNQKILQAGDENINSILETILQNALGKLAKDLEVWQGQSPSVGELSAWILNKIQSSPNDRWIIIVDSAFEANWKLLAALEARLLGALATMTNVLILITGRGKPYPWQSPYLRTQARQIELINLSKEQAYNQINYYKNHQKELGVAMIPEVKWATIISESDGHPLANILLAQNADFNTVIDYLLEIVNKPDRALVRQYLEALCPLDNFIEDHIGPMLDAYSGEQCYERMKRLDLRRQVLDKLIQTNLVHWQDGGYLIDTNLRSYLRRFMQLEKKEIWQRLTAKAYDLFISWAKQFPQNSEDARYYHKQAEQYSERNL
ncbi:MAG TPA: hypothetical protein PLT26_14510 [Anaerolineaceae bacterium]|nr:hypothetical protein [Anaerolineaceae bacterium]